MAAGNVVDHGGIEIGVRMLDTSREDRDVTDHLQEQLRRSHRPGPAPRKVRHELGQLALRSIVAAQQVALATLSRSSRRRPLRRSART